MAGPPRRWMAPSTPPPPSNEEFAALTTASTLASVMSLIASVMSTTASLPHVTDSHEFSSQGIPVFETERLIARPWTQDDADRHFDMYSRWEVARWLGSVPAPLETRDESVARIERWALGARRDSRFGLWAIEATATGVVVGS